MFIAMNRFRIAHGAEKTFEEVWRTRDSYLSEVSGFKEFHLLKGPQTDEYVLYASHSVWESEAAFRAWTKSDHFRRAHAKNRAPADTYLGGPKLETFEAVL
ncbi:MAG: antibiotic biosynthesis monooxygenase [Pseudomonadales bacterium]|nr:antibiotic biosynthesis monooxygenase [Pseudomonadales bacterium]